MKPLPERTLPRLNKALRGLIAFALLALSHTLWADDFQNGLKAYESGDFTAAAQSFEKAAGTGETAAARHNLALSAYQSGQPAEAVWQLERALRIEPRNKEYRFKLGALRQQLGLPPGPPSWPEAAASTLPAPQWAWLSTLALWTALAAWILPAACKHKPGLGLRAARILGLCLFAAAIPALEFHRRAESNGIVTSMQSIELRAAPADAAPQTGLARPGERVRILDSHGDFHRVRTEGAASGWLTREAFRRIRLGDA